VRTFVDTSGFYALADRSDRHHLGASAAFTHRAVSEQWLTTDHVVVETWLLLRARLGYRAALRFWDAIGAGLATVAGLSSADLVRARALAEQWRDHEFSFVDCTSFALIERLGLDRALAFDAHFEMFRFGPGRRKRLKLAALRATRRD
jgi:uncharacterized protein